MMMNHPRFAEYPLALRGGWAAAGIEVMNQIRERMGMAGVCYCYGLSEASPNVICSRFDDPWEEREAGLGLGGAQRDVDVRDARAYNLNRRIRIESCRREPYRGSEVSIDGEAGSNTLLLRTAVAARRHHIGGRRRRAGDAHQHQGDLCGTFHGFRCSSMRR